MDSENRILTEVAKFVKGQSGNPGGRPKALFDIQSLAREKTKAALNTLAEIMENTEAPHAARVSAACALLDRGYGKPTQTTELTGANGGPIETVEISENERARRIAFALEQGMRMPENHVVISKH